MRGKKARALRKKIFGDNYSYRFREYKKTDKGQIIATGLRRAYQEEKKQWKI